MEIFEKIVTKSSTLRCRLFLSFILYLFFSFPVISQSWYQLGNDIDGETIGAQAGFAASLSDDGLTVAIGSPFNNENGAYAGQVQIFKLISGSWTQLGSDIEGEEDLSRSGFSVSLSGDGLTVAIGATMNNGGGQFSGHVQVFKYISGNWTQLGSDIDGELPSDQSGWAVSLNIDGTTVAIGSPYHNNGGSTGQVRVYEQDLTGGTVNWIQKGQNLSSQEPLDFSGQSVSLSDDGELLAIGAPNNIGSGNYEGSVRVYKYILGSWVQQGADIDGDLLGARLGFAVSLSADGLTVGIGNPCSLGTSSCTGQVKVYKFISGSWIQQGNSIVGLDPEDQIGTAVSLSADGTIIAVGAKYFESVVFREGQVRIFKLNAGIWEQIGTDIYGEYSSDESGNSVSLSADGQTVAIGAPFNSENGETTGHVRVYSVNPLGIIENDFGKELSVFPNPTKGDFFIELGKDYQSIEVKIYASNAELISKNSFHKTQLINLKINGTAGVYFVNIKTKNKQAIIRIFKE